VYNVQHCGQVLEIDMFICEACSAVIWEGEEATDRRKLSIQALHKSKSLNGCYMCSIILETLKHFRSTSSIDDLQRLGNWTVWGSLAKLQFTASKPLTRSASDEWQTPHLYYYVPPGKPLRNKMRA